MLSFAHRRHVPSRARGRLSGSRWELHRGFQPLNSSAPQTARYRIASKFSLSIGITVIIIIAQLFIAHQYIGLNISHHINSRLYQDDAILKNEWLCYSAPYLSDINKLAQKYGVKLVIVDPDLLRALDNNDQSEENFIFSSGARVKQELGHKSIIHIAAINETSNGQPNLMQFYNSLKHQNYVTIKYNDASHAMRPEIYWRKPHVFDEMLSDKIGIDQSNGKSIGHLDGRPLILRDDIEVSKIYTDFMSHLFIVDQSQHIFDHQTKACQRTRAIEASPFAVIHIFILYNFEHKPGEQWIQSGLIFEEMDKHKLLTYKVHSLDFRVPIEHYFIHQKRETTSLDFLGGYHVLEPEGDRSLRYASNTFIHCKRSPFNIIGQIDNTRQVSNYIKLIDGAQPIRFGQSRDMIIQQYVVAFKFMDTFSKAYGNFSYWTTGSSLLAYHKFCDLSTVSPNELEKKSGEEYDTAVLKVTFNLELGLLASELNETMLEDLANAKMIGVTMVSDWRKPNALIAFRIVDCPNLIFNIHMYELKRDFYEYYFITRNSMILSHKFSRRGRSSNSSSGLKRFVGGHHVFRTNNLKLCWTYINYFHPFRVPCDVHDHLRRIYVI